MPKALPYKRGDCVGPGQAIYLEEVQTDDRFRKALFECGYCGNTFESHVARVKRGNTKSCGCKSRIGRRVSHRTHGFSDSKLYSAWNTMHGRGMCQSWKDFVIFKDWAIANGYQPGKQIERRDLTNGFTPENSYFQGFSKSKGYCWLNGERMSFSEAGRRLGKSREAIRLYSLGKIKSIPDGLKFSEND